ISSLFTANLTAHFGSLLCIQPLNLQYCFLSLISGKQSVNSSCSIFLKSRELNPGVSATSPSLICSNSTCLVVCLPRPKLLDISAVFKSKEGSNVLRIDDFPTPDCPAITVIWLGK